MAIPANVVKYTEDFESESSVTVTHNLGYYPIVVVQWDTGSLDYDYRALGAPVKHVSKSQFIIDFGNYTFSGRITYE